MLLEERPCARNVRCSHGGAIEEGEPLCHASVVCDAGWKNPQRLHLRCTEAYPPPEKLRLALLPRGGRGVHRLRPWPLLPTEVRTAAPPHPGRRGSLLDTPGGLHELG